MQNPVTTRSLDGGSGNGELRHRHAVGRPSKAILAALRGRVCKILHPNFREFPF
jgi:hypothetical protein